MSLEYTLRGPTTVQLSGPVLTPSGPLILDAAPLAVSDAPVVGETVTIHYATRNLTISDVVIVREAASKDVTPISLSDTLSATDKVALVLEDDVVVSEGLDLSPAMVGSQVRVNPFFPGTGSVGSPIQAGISYTPIDVTGSVIRTNPFFTPTDITGSSLSFKANLPTAAASDVLTVVERLDVIQHPKDALTAHEALGREWDITVSEHIALVADNVSSGPLVLDHLFPAEHIGRIFALSLTDLLTATDPVALGFSDHLTVTEVKGFRRDVLEALTAAESISVSSSLHDVLVFTELTTSFKEIAEALTVFDDIRRVHPVAVSDTLVTVLNVTFSEFKPTADALGVIEVVASLASTFTRSITDALTAKDGASPLINLPYGKAVCREGYPVTLGERNTVILTYPYLSPSATLTLRNPRFGNVDNFTTNTKFRRSLNNQLNVVRATSWPVIEVLKVSFEALSQQDVNDFISFMEQGAGFEVGYLDHEARQWRGFILTDGFETEQYGQDCQFRLSFEFRGKLA